MYYFKLNLEVKKIEKNYNSLDPPQQEQIKIGTGCQIFGKKLNKVRGKGETSKLLEGVLEEKRREIIKEWIDSDRIEA